MTTKDVLIAFQEEWLVRQYENPIQILDVFECNGNVYFKFGYNQLRLVYLINPQLLDRADNARAAISNMIDTCIAGFCKDCGRSVL